MNAHPATATPTATAFATALAEDREAVVLRADLRDLRAQAAGLREDLAAERARHERELADVEGLTGLGLRSLAASVRGTRRAELDREQAEETEARARAVAALARLTGAEDRAEEVDRRLARLGDTAARRETAAQAYAEELRTSTHPVAPHVDEVLTALAAARDRLAQLEQVREAGARAAASLDSARSQLSSADGWSTYDTFAGGGLLSSAVKHQHADGASRSIAEAQHAIVDLAGALRDVGEVAGLRADLGVGPGTRTMDVWFDNLVSDWAVRSRIKDQLAGVERASAAVREAVGQTTAEHARASAVVEDLVRRRDALLGA
jgi:hypothetical protein